ncbi:kinase-like domain-containing protein [Nemania sp. NC0429]|nr:kinase-like domain-containing protein [Nemania sp. NC0429]
MAPQITSWEELLWVSEELDEDTGDFQYTMFAAVEDDMIYYGHDSLARIPDEKIFPQWWSQGLTPTKASEELPSNVFIKRPRLGLYDIFLKHGVVYLLAKGLMEEAEAMEVLGSQPHPNIVRYHGCHVRRGYITGLVLERHPHDLNSYLNSSHITQDKELFLESLGSAIHRVHSLGWAHNDLNPTNVLVAEDGRPILIDFGSARRIGDKLSTSRDSPIFEG